MVVKFIETITNHYRLSKKVTKKRSKSITNTHRKNSNNKAFQRDYDLFDYPLKIVINKKENPKEFVDRFRSLIRRLRIKYYENKKVIIIWDTKRFMEKWDIIKNILIY